MGFVYSRGIVAKTNKPIRKMAKLKGVLGKTEQHQAEGPISPSVFYKKLRLKLAGKEVYLYDGVIVTK